MAALDAVWVAYQALCEQYIRLFCEAVEPDATLDFCFDSSLSARWQRVAVQQAAGIAQSWRSNRRNALQTFHEKRAWYEALPETEQQTRKKPMWNEPHLPE